jgi:hypothetical protein
MSIRDAWYAHQDILSHTIKFSRSNFIGTKDWFGMIFLIMFNTFYTNLGGIKFVIGVFQFKMAAGRA